MSLKKLVKEMVEPIIEDVGGIVASDGTIKGGSKLSKIKKMKKKGHTSVPYGSGYKKVNESEINTIHNLLQRFGNSSKDATNMIKKNYKKVAKKFKGQTPRDKAMALIGLSLLGERWMSNLIEEPRKPRKKGQHQGSKSHSDLYTDENPKGTIKGLKFATVKDAIKSVSKINGSGKTHAHKIQAAVAMEQRAREMGKSSQAAVYRAYINKMKKKTKKKNEITESKKIKKVIGVFGGRFQPFHSGHLATYKWLSKRVDEAYITTSNIKKPPRHPMDFKEKVKHMVKMGIPKNRIIEEKTPYVAKNLLKKFNSETTAVVYAFGQKDAGRLRATTKKDGSKSYYQDFNKNKHELKGHEEHGYYLTAPQSGNLSGTKTREMLGSPTIHDKEKLKFFKKTFGYYDKSLYNMMTDKFKKLYEFYIHLYESSGTQSGGVDDGPGFLSSLKKYQNRAEVEAGKLGWEVSNILVGDEYFNQNFDFVKDTKYPKGPVGSVSYGPAGAAAPSAQNDLDLIGTEMWNHWMRHIDRILSNQEYEYVDDLKKERGISIKDSSKTLKTLTDEEPKEIDVNRGNEQHDDYEIVKEIMSLTSNLPKNGKELLLMGGAYGHMSHPFDNKDLTFGDLKKIITNGLGGTLSREDNVTEKTDGQNLMVSWKNGKLIAARNKGHLKNKGETALSIKDVESKFKGRGDIRNAFVYAMRDLSKAIGALSQKQKDKIFGEGSKFMSLEVLWPASENVVNYDITELMFHGALEYDDSGKVIGQAKDSARMLAGMIKQVNQNIQKHYKIKKPNFLTVPKHQDFGKLKSKFLNKLNKLQSKYSLSDSDTLSMYHQMYWQEWIMNGAVQTDYPKINASILVKLTKRWAFFDKSYKIPQIKKDLKEHPKFLDWVLSTDKNDQSKMVKKNMKPFEEIFFEVGATILNNMDGWMAVNPAKSVQNMRKKVQSAIKDIRSGGDLKKLNKLKQQLNMLNSIGGLEAIVPTEGIVFKYKGNTYKFTGAFAPVNQITGMMTFNR